ncbi:unnamed protein product [Prorocentrum cordatum]|uniref:Uncharacterized protein n=1 Tax=Prorocentrum cordatum TaxID=2364126 RepID=A0ABN9RC34_9DINO|nr:unnamed protein product [Polarella glacialis]
MTHYDGCAGHGGAARQDTGLTAKGGLLRCMSKGRHDGETKEGEERGGGGKGRMRKPVALDGRDPCASLPGSPADAPSLGVHALQRRVLARASRQWGERVVFPSLPHPSKKEGAREGSTGYPKTQ